MWIPKDKNDTASGFTGLESIFEDFSGHFLNCIETLIKSTKIKIPFPLTHHLFLLLKLQHLLQIFVPIW